MDYDTQAHSRGPGNGSGMVPPPPKAAGKPGKAPAPATNGQNLPQERNVALYQLFAANKARVTSVLPKHMTPERMLRIAYDTASRPDLAACDPRTILNSVVMASTLGLEVSHVLGHAYLVPYGREAQLIVGYKGLIELARRSGQISYIDVDTIHDNDDFDCVKGLDPVLKHKPCLKGPRGEMYAAYAVAHFKDGGKFFVTMSKEEMDQIRNFSKAAQSSSSPWKKWPLEMYKKTVLRRLCKLLPLSPEYAKPISLAMDVDNRADTGESQLAAAAAVVIDIDPAAQQASEGDGSRTGQVRGKLLKAAAAQGPETRLCPHGGMDVAVAVCDNCPHGAEVKARCLAEESQAGLDAQGDYPAEDPAFQGDPGPAAE